MSYIQALTGVQLFCEKYQTKCSTSTDDMLPVGAQLPAQSFYADTSPLKFKPISPTPSLLVVVLVLLNFYMYIDFQPL